MPEDALMWKKSGFDRKFPGGNEKGMRCEGIRNTQQWRTENEKSRHGGPAEETGLRL